MVSRGYADEDVLNGKYSEASDNFAVGRTLLVVLTNRNPVGIIEALEEANDADFEEIPAAALGSSRTKSFSVVTSAAP